MMMMMKTKILRGKIMELWLEKDINECNFPVLVTCGYQFSA